MGKTERSFARSGESMAHQIVGIDRFDLRTQRYQHTEPMKLERYHYKLPCFCGEEIKLIPENGQRAECPERCGGVARFDEGRASIEAAVAS